MWSLPPIELLLKLKAIGRGKVFDFLQRWKDGQVPDHAPEAEKLFRKVASEFNLKIEKRENDPVELAMALPKQHGLRSEIWLCLQNVDELWFTVEGITCSLFPFEKVKDEFEEYLRSLLNGEYRLVTWTKDGDTRS